MPDGFTAKGVSTLYNADGEITAQWVKSRADDERQLAMLRAAFDGMADELPRAAPTAKPKQVTNGLANLYPIADFHLGMLAWNEEAGEDWDTDIAEDLLVRWFERAIAQSPDAEVGVLAQLGDFLHWDGLDAVTPEHKNILDADTRFAKLVRVAIRVLRRVIGMLLEKHRHVHVYMVEGNHDPASSIWLREWLTAIYEKEKRLTVDNSPTPYYCFEWGQSSLFFTHGHKGKFPQVDSIFAGMFRDVFGRTKHSYAHCAHLHFDALTETRLMKVEQHRTLAPKDAYAARGGYLSGRSAKVITYSDVYGEVGRVTVTPEMCK